MNRREWPGMTPQSLKRLTITIDKTALDEKVEGEDLDVESKAL